MSNEAYKTRTLQNKIQSLLPVMSCHYHNGMSELLVGVGVQDQSLVVGVHPEQEVPSTSAALRVTHATL